MAGKCSEPSCNPEETGCNVGGYQNLKKCKFYKGTENNASTSENSGANEDPIFRVPWTGNTLGLNDFNILSAVNNPIIIGITGATNAGKTTFLAALFCLLRNGKSIGNYQFAGSLTLVGWENIAYYLSWKENGNIKFPPHTSVKEGRVPGLLHIALRDPEGKKFDVVFTDAPGEWFEQWRVNKEATNAAGAKWIYENADALLLFADCESLSSEEKGKSRYQLRSVADRISEDLGIRPFGLIWSKSDIIVSEEEKEQISNYIKRRNIINYNEFQTSARSDKDGKFHDDILESVNWIIKINRANLNSSRVLSSYIPEDMFLSKR